MKAFFAFICIFLVCSFPALADVYLSYKDRMLSSGLSFDLNQWGDWKRSEDEMSLGYVCEDCSDYSEFRFTIFEHNAGTFLAQSLSHGMKEFCGELSQLRTGRCVDGKVVDGFKFVSQGGSQLVFEQGDRTFVILRYVFGPYLFEGRFVSDRDQIDVTNILDFLDATLQKAGPLW